MATSTSKGSASPWVDDRGLPLGTGKPSKTFTFIVGRGRSGTTLLRAMFDAHPDIAIPDESHFIVPLGRRRTRYEAGAAFATDRFLSDLRPRKGFDSWRGIQDRVVESLYTYPPSNYPDAVRRLYALYALHEQDRGKTRYGDKTPIHVLHMEFLLQLFPEARFIHMIRDGRNSCLSYLDVTFGPQDLWEAAISWKRAVAAGRHAGAVLGSTRYREVRYEDLVEDPEATLRGLCEFVDLEFDLRMLRYFEAERVEKVACRSHHKNVRLPPTRGMRNWRQQMTARELALFEALAGDLLSELGYERACPEMSLSQRLQAHSLWLRVQAQRGAARACKLTSRQQRRLRAVRNGLR